MIYYIAIDDTDTLESKGTGEIAEDLSHELAQFGFGKPSAVSRHQLFFHPDIPYTSHNSSMCFELSNATVASEVLTAFCADFLKQHSAEGSDPGLCIANPAEIFEKDKLITFGYRAKKEVLTKAFAFETAARHHVHLSEHGGTGDGIIGALAGLALRLDGNDGRYKGQVFLGENCDNMTVEDILVHPLIDRIQTENGDILPNEAVIYVSDRIKTVRIDGCAVLLVKSVSKGGDWLWKPISKDNLKQY